MPKKETKLLTKLLDRPARPVRGILPIILSAFIIIALAAASYFYWQVKQLKTQGTSAAAQDEQRQLVDKVSKLVVLPTDEEPTIASVTDLEKLKDQPFFASAKIGDKVLIYTKAKKAILYRPSENKIIEIAPLNIGENSPNPTPLTDPKSQVTVRVLNGSGTSGLAARVADKLKQAGFTQVTIGDASLSDQTIIQYKTEKAETASTINQILKNQASLKVDSNISSDIVITLGQNFNP